MAELLGRVERLALNTGGQPQLPGQAQVKLKSIFHSRNLCFNIQGVPNDVARIQDINRVINSNTDMTRTIQSFAYVFKEKKPKLDFFIFNFIDKS
jgi:hypothetical protein